MVDRGKYGGKLNAIDSWEIWGFMRYGDVGRGDKQMIDGDRWTDTRQIEIKGFIYGGMLVIDRRWMDGCVKLNAIDSQKMQLWGFIFGDTMMIKGDRRQIGIRVKLNVTNQRNLQQ